jgi:hypothetical protein
MSFTGNATYAQLYPSRSPGDAGEKIYEQGSVFLREYDKVVEIFILAEIHDGLILVCVNDGNRWSDGNITSINNDHISCTESELLRSFYPMEDEFKFVGLAKDVLGLNARAARLASGPFEDA